MSTLDATETAFTPLTVENCQPCFQLHLKGQPSPWSSKIFEDCLSQPYFAFSLNQKEQLLGYYIAMKVLDEVTLMDIVINENEQGKGFGKQLLQHLIDYCMEHKLQQIWLEVRESNLTAINMYDKAGFILVEQRVNYYPTKTGKEDAMIMCLYLG